MKQLMKRFLSKKLAAAAALSASPAAFAGSGGSADSFGDWVTTLEGYAKGGLGTSIALAMLLLGGGMGVAKNNPIPALSGVAGAAIMKFGPAAITGIMGYSGAIF